MSKIGHNETMIAEFSGSATEEQIHAAINEHYNENGLEGRHYYEYVDGDTMAIYVTPHGIKGIEAMIIHNNTVIAEFSARPSCKEVKQTMRAHYEVNKLATEGDQVYFYICGDENLPITFKKTHRHSV